MRYLPPGGETRRSRSGDSPTLLSSGLPHFLDERSQPDFRAVFGLLARRSGRFDSAVARIRLAGLDLRPDELRGVDRIRVLLGQVNGLTLRSEAEAMLVDPVKATNLRNLVALIEAGRIEIRSAPLAGWSPDFTVFHRKGRPWTVLIGLHWFARPFPNRGPALASLHGAAASSRSSTRFGELWKKGHDIGPAILALLREADERAARPPERNEAIQSPARRTSVARAGNTLRGQDGHGIQRQAENLDSPP